MFAALLTATMMTLAAAPDVEDEPGSARITTRDDPPPAPNKPAPRRATRETPRYVPESAAAVEDEREDEESGRSKLAPAIVLGGSVIAGVVGVVFAMRTLDALEQQPASINNALFPGTRGSGVDIPDPDAIRAQQEEVLVNGLATTMLFSAAIAGIVTSTLLLIAD
jgi:hypothetical protein